VAGAASGTGSNNTYLGLASGEQATGSYNVFLGRWAGRYEYTNSNRLIIESNYNSTDYFNNALIYGDFSADQLRFNATVGIGTTYSSAYGLVVNGGSSSSYSMYVYKGAYTPGQFYSASDARFKTDIEKIMDPLEKLNQLHGVYFNWKKDEYPDMEFSDKRQVGILAQDVEKVLPEIVGVDENGYKAVAYDKLTVVLIEAVKEQQKMINELKAEIEQLKKK
jgi:hypothetical protein